MTHEQFESNAIEAETAISAAVAELREMHADQESIDAVNALRAQLGELSESDIINEAERIVTEIREEKAAGTDRLAA